MPLLVINSDPKRLWGDDYDPSTGPDPIDPSPGPDPDPEPIDPSPGPDPSTGPDQNYLCFDFTEAGTGNKKLIFESTYGSDNIVSSSDFPWIAYSVDNGNTWEEVVHGDENVYIDIPITDGLKVYWKAVSTKYAYNANRYYHFKIDDSSYICNISGNIMSLLYGDYDDFSEETSFPEGSDKTFIGLFRQCTEASFNGLLLPATTLVGDCYNSMFYGCTGLTTAPTLPATSLTNNCYMSMFYGCTGLTTAPTLPATSLASQCYNGMFSDCTGLTTAPTLPATSLAMSCYTSMFLNCSGLTTAPELPATTIAYTAYTYMFKGCSNLNYIKVLATSGISDNWLKDWLKDTAATGTFVKATGAQYSTGTSGIPNGWTVEEV